MDFVIRSVFVLHVFPVTIDIADAAHAKQTTFRERRVGKFFLHIFRTTRHNECVVDIIRCHSRPFDRLRAGSGGDLLLGKASGFKVGRSVFLSFPHLINYFFQLIWLKRRILTMQHCMTIGAYWNQILDWIYLVIFPNF